MDLHPSILVKDRKSGDKQNYRMDRESIIIGRDQGHFIVLPSRRVSRRHAEIRFENGSFFIVDLESGNGTYVNSQRLVPNEKMLLRSSDRIRIDSYEIVFQVNGSTQPDFSEVTDTDILEIKMIKKLLNAVDKENAPVLEVVGGGHTGKRFVLEGKNQEIVIGRDPACEFQIDSEVISRKHARVIKKWDTVTILDLASKNGVFVNDARVSEQVLKDGDRILLGTLPLLYRNPTEHGWDYLAAEPPPQPEHTGEEVSVPSFKREEPSGFGRVARRVDSKGTEAKEALPTEAASAEVAPPAPEATAEPTLPLWQRFSPLEIGAALVGLIILIGSLWLLLKLL